MAGSSSAISTRAPAQGYLVAEMSLAQRGGIRVEIGPAVSLLECAQMLPYTAQRRGDM